MPGAKQALVALGQGFDVLVVALFLHRLAKCSAALRSLFPSTVFASFSKLTRVYEAVRDDARIKAWYAR